jgi:redox-sensitive bicupin YhaK (pirin superfamily)
MNYKERKLTTVYTPEAHPGFLGKGHTAKPVIDIDFTKSDPFIMLMDDILDKTDHIPVGGPHPHAGFETVTLVLQGEIGEGPHALKAGDFEMMTAGSGVVHTEILAKPMKMRILQLWLNLPKQDRKASPRVQRLAANHVPAVSKEGVNIKVYSGSFGGVSSPVKNHTPFILAEIKMEPGASTTQILPADFHGFFYVLDGTVHVGADQQALTVDHVGWLDSSNEPGDSQVTLTAGDTGAHFVLYAAQPQHHQIVSHGPFIADSLDDIKQLYADYRAGKMEHITEVSAEQQLSY